MELSRRSVDDVAASQRASAAMERYASGADEALGEVYDSVAPKLLRFFLRQTRDAALADDLLQQTFLNMHCARATFRKGADVIPWAFAIGHRLLIDEVRRRRRRPILQADDDSGAEGTQAPSSAPPVL